jgi:hypothetical protein
VISGESIATAEESGFDSMQRQEIFLFTMFRPEIQPIGKTVGGMKLNH